MRPDGHWWQRDFSFRSLLLGTLGLCVLVYVGYRWTGRDDAAHERRELVEWAGEFEIPGSTASRTAELKERDCPAGQPRQAIRAERSSSDQRDLLPDLLAQAATLDWTANSTGLPVVGAPADLSQPAATLDRGDWKLEVWLAPLDDGTDVRLVVSTGVGGLRGCY